MPLATWRFHEANPIVLDPGNRIICFRYYATGGYKEQHSYNIIYDVKMIKFFMKALKMEKKTALSFPFQRN